MLNIKRLSHAEAEILIQGATIKSSEMDIPMCIAVTDHVTNGGHFSIIGGGLPVTVEEQIVGGIGISSGTAKEDQVVAEAAIEYFYIQTGFKA